MSITGLQDTDLNPQLGGRAAAPWPKPLALPGPQENAGKGGRLPCMGANLIAFVAAEAITFCSAEFWKARHKGIRPDSAA